MTRRKVVVTCGLVIVVVAGITAAYVAERWHHVPTIRGSPTVEYVPSSIAPRPAPVPGVAWPTYGYDQERRRSARRSACGRRSGASGRSTDARCSSSRRLSDTGACTSRTSTDGSSLSTPRPARPCGATAPGRCGWASPALADHLVYETFIGSHECHSRADDGEIAAFDARDGRVAGSGRSARPSRHRSSRAERSTSETGTDACGRSTRTTGRTRWTAELRRRDQGVARAQRGSALHRYIRRRRRLARVREPAECSGGRGGHGRVLLVARGRVRPRLHRLARRRRLRVRRDDRAICSGRTRRAATSMPRAAVCGHRVLVGSYDHRFYAFDAGDRRGPLALRRERTDLGRRERDRRPRVLLDVQRANVRACAPNGASGR